MPYFTSLCTCEKKKLSDFNKQKQGVIENLWGQKQNTSTHKVTLADRKLCRIKRNFEQQT